MRVTISEETRASIIEAAINPAPGFADHFRPAGPGAYELDLGPDAAARVERVALPGEDPSQTIERTVRAATGRRAS